MNPYKRPISALVVVTTLQGQVLVLQKAKWPLFWQSVTGSLDWDESAVPCAQRELFEETGLTLADGFWVDTGRVHTYQIYQRFKPRYAPDATLNQEHVFYFVLPKAQSIRLSDEHLAARWVSCAQALKCVLSQTNRDEICRATAWLKQVRQGRCQHKP